MVFPRCFFPPPFSGKQWENHGFSHDISANYGNLRKFFPSFYCTLLVFLNDLGHHFPSEDDPRSLEPRHQQVRTPVGVPALANTSQCQGAPCGLEPAKGLIYDAGVFHIDRYIICYIYILYIYILYIYYIYILYIYYIYTIYIYYIYTIYTIYIYTIFTHIHICIYICISSYLPLYISTSLPIYLPTYWYLSIYPYFL